MKLTEAAIRRATDPQSFTRGQQYFASGHVRKLAVDGAKASARVNGTAAYRVKLALTTSGLTGQCSCPYDTFCEHCVATAFAWLRKGGKVSSPPPKKPADLRKFLETRTSSWLIDQLLKAASTDSLLLARLEVAAGADASSAYDAGPLRERLERAIDIPSYVDHYESQAYVETVAEAVDGVAALVPKGFPVVAIEAAEYALELLEDASERIEDPDDLGGAIDRLEEIHFAACSAGDPDPVQLAERLATRALDSEWEIFATALPGYAPILGPDGMARYRTLVKASTSYAAERLLERWAEQP